MLIREEKITAISETKLIETTLLEDMNYVLIAIIAYFCRDHIIYC